MAGKDDPRNGSLKWNEHSPKIFITQKEKAAQEQHSSLQ